MTRRVLVTGADGFVGGHLVRGLDRVLPAEDAIHAAGRQFAPGAQGRVRFGPLDVLDREEVRGVFGEAAPTHVVHLAAASSVHEALVAPANAWITNVAGTANVAEAMVRADTSAVLLMVSTSEVYGASFEHHDPADESTPPRPLNPYARSKAAAEQAALDVLRPGQRAIVVRPFNHVGPGQDERFVVASFAAQIARIEAGLHEPVLKVGDLSARRDFLDVEDVVSAYALLILRGDELPARTTFNVCSGVGRSIESIVTELRALSEVQIAVEVEAERLRPPGIASAVGSSSLLRETLGWQPRVPWGTSLARVLEFWRGRVREARA